MNERVRAILIAASKLSADERRELSEALMSATDADQALAERLAAEERASRGAAEEAPQQPTSDVLAKYLDV